MLVYSAVDAMNLLLEVCYLSLCLSTVFQRGSFQEQRTGDGKKMMYDGRGGDRKRRDEKNNDCSKTRSLALMIVMC